MPRGDVEVVRDGAQHDDLVLRRRERGRAAVICQRAARAQGVPDGDPRHDHPPDAAGLQDKAAMAS